MAKSAPGARISAFFCSGFSPSQGWVLIGAAAAAAFDPAKIAALRAVFHAGNSAVLLRCWCFAAIRRRVARSQRNISPQARSRFFLPPFRARRARSIAGRIIPGTHLDHEGHFWPPPCRGAGNVRAGTGPRPRFGHRVPKSGPAGWAIPPDPQQPRGGEIPVR